MSCWRVEAISLHLAKSENESALDEWLSVGWEPYAVTQEGPYRTHFLRIEIG